MRTINIIIDYKNNFGTKYTASPYRSGMDKEKISEFFRYYGYNVNFIRPFNIDYRECENHIFLYTSSEDRGLYYKSFIEDVVLGLKLSGAIIIPDFHFLRAHHNKVLMEILRKISKNKFIDSLNSQVYGTLEELIEDKNRYSDETSYVIKPSEGAMSKGVSLASNIKQLTKFAKQISKTKSLKYDIIDKIRSIKHKGYIKDSKNRKKFIVQTYIPGLTGDWKVLVFWNKFYVLHRQNRKNDFRASGGGRLSFTREVPVELLNFSKNVVSNLNIPNASLDIAFNGTDYYLLEFQAIYFGTYTLEHSEFYFKFEQDWKIVETKSILEKEYVYSIVNYINNNFKYKINQ